MCFLNMVGVRILVALSRQPFRWLLRPRGLQKQCKSYSTNVTPINMAYSVIEGPQPNKESKPLIVMHGLLGSKQNWRGVSRAVSAKLNNAIYTVDARNHGESPHTEKHSSAHMAVDVAELIRTKGFPKANVMGHSMGGRTMMYLALKYPDIVNRLIVVDISPISIPHDFTEMNNILTAMETVQIDKSLSMAQGRVVAEKQIKSVVDDKATVDFIVMNLRKKDSGEFYWMPNIKTLHQNMYQFGTFLENMPDVTPFQGPTMFICGKYSSYVDPSSWPSIQEIFPNSEIHWLDAGHLVHFSQPAQFIELVVKFLNE